LIYQHAEELRKQMALNEEKRKQESRTALEEGKKIKDKLAKEKKTLETIKSNKLDQLIGTGVEHRYTTDLAKKKIII